MFDFNALSTQRCLPFNLGIPGIGLLKLETEYRSRGLHPFVVCFFLHEQYISQFIVALVDEGRHGNNGSPSNRIHAPVSGALLLFLAVPLTLDLCLVSQ